MPCSRCGDICRCFSQESSIASSRWVGGPDAISSAEASPAAPAAGEDCESNPQSLVDAALPGAVDERTPADSSGWRLELAARLNRYQSRRKPRPPRYPSLLLRFEGDDAIRASAPPSPFTQPGSHHALALDEYPMSKPVVGVEPRNLAETGRVLETSGSRREVEPADDFSDDTAVTGSVTGRIIEFPRSWTPPPVPLDQLAEPVMSRPRILEAPEFAPPPPALGGITIEPPQQPEMEKRPGIDIPLKGAPLGRRSLSALIDDVIIVAACALFGFVFWKLTAIQPPRLQMICFVGGLAALLWAAYQYLLMVYAGITPGLHWARLELTRFDGSSAGRRLRRWRVLASYLSAISLGMGYLWVFLDEDSLCWHDRITHTYLAPKKPAPTSDK